MPGSGSALDVSPGKGLGQMTSHLHLFFLPACKVATTRKGHPGLNESVISGGTAPKDVVVGVVAKYMVPTTLLF